MLKLNNMINFSEDTTSVEKSYSKGYKNYIGTSASEFWKNKIKSRRWFGVP